MLRGRNVNLMAKCEVVGHYVSDLHHTTVPLKSRIYHRSFLMNYFIKHLRYLAKLKGLTSRWTNVENLRVKVSLNLPENPVPLQLSGIVLKNASF